MKRLLVILETNGTRVRASSMAAIEFAQALAVPFDVLIAGAPSSAAEADAWTGTGAERVLTAASTELAHPTADRLAALCGRLMDEGTSLAGPSTMADVLARVAGALDLPMASEVEGFEMSGGQPAVRHATCDGRVRQTARVDAPRAVFSIRTGIAKPAGHVSAASAASAVVALDTSDLPSDTTWISEATTVHTRPPLDQARVIVAGGRSLGDAAAFEQYLGKAADKLGGAVAASGGAVHSGIAPAAQLIGQTGQTVAPELYIAVGISGADQHVGGMRNSRVVVAVNRDPQATIFRVADYGLVADFREAMPELAEKL